MSDALDRLKAALGDRYAIEREIGEGGMATVYLAEDVRHQRKVALKVLRPELAATMGPERFLQEVRVTANLQHPHILPLFDSGEADGFLYYVMPYLEGESLRERVAREGELPVAEAVRILKDVVDALAAAHQMGVVHRDIKPDNVMLSGRHAVVTDFGVAKAVSEATGRHQLTTAGVALGTPSYMAPEQAAADDNIDHRADIYAVGAMGYELLAGRPPFSGMTAQQVLSAHVTQAPREVTEHRAAVPPGLGAVIMRCLEKKPADRWQRAEDLLAQLEAYATPTAGVTPTQSVPVTTAGTVPVGGGLPFWLKVAVPLGAVAIGLALWATMTDRGLVSEGTSDVASAEVVERLMVLPLRNLSSDPELDVWGQLAADQMARAIDRARPIVVVPSTTVQDAIRLLGADASAASIAENVGASFAFAGTVASTGGQLRFEVELLGMASGARLRSLDPAVGPVGAADSVVAALAQRVAAAAVAQFDPGEAESVASSLRTIPVSVAAFREYQTQNQLFCEVDYPGSIAAGERVEALSPGFVGALFARMVAHSNLGNDAEADSLIGVLNGMRDRMTALEQASLDWMIGNRTDDPRLAERAADEMWRLDPSGVAAGSSMLTMYRVRRFDDAIERLQATLPGQALCPWPGVYTQGSVAYHALGRYEDAIELARTGLGYFPDRPSILGIELQALAALGRFTAVDSLLDYMGDLPSTDDLHYYSVLAGREARAHGFAQEAERLFQRGLEGYASEPTSANTGRAYYYAGRWEVADTLLASLVERFPESLDLAGMYGATLARLGRRAEALAISERLGAVTGSYLNGVHIRGQAMIAAALGDRDEAVRLIRLGQERDMRYGVTLHLEPTFLELRGYPPFDALMAPR